MVYTSAQPRLVRRPRVAQKPLQLDAVQQTVVQHRGGPLLVLAGPGTGKTTTIVEAVADRIERDHIDPEQILVLTFSRKAATDLARRICYRLGKTTTEPLARTFHSYAFGLLRREALRKDLPVPQLLTSAEQDVLIRDLLQGDVENVGADYWPDWLRPALLTHGFAAQLRDFMMRATERGITPDDVEALGRRHDRLDWVAAAAFARQYAGVTALRQPPSYDPAELIQAAISLLKSDSGLLASERERPLIVVDEYQDSDPAQEELIILLREGGRDLLAVGDPDQSIYGFRGADPDVIRRFPERFRAANGSPAAVASLEKTRRCGPVLVDATRRVAARLGGVSPHRQMCAADPSQHGEVAVHVLGNASQEAAFVAATLRESHLLHDVPWESMAVIARTTAALDVLRRGLSNAGVPVRHQTDEVPLAQRPAVRDLLTIVELAIGVRELDAEVAVNLLTGPLGEADVMAIRRIKRELRAQELADKNDRSSSELLVEALCDPINRVEGEESAVVRIARALREANHAVARPGTTIEDVLWAIWSSLRIADTWAHRAVSRHRLAELANANLDAVTALFEASANYVDRLPGSGPADFVESLRDQRIPSRGSFSSQRAGIAEPAVALVTAHAAKGMEWDVVAVAGVQEGVWPDIRQRGSLLDPELLVSHAAGVGQSHPVIRANARLAEERRLFYVATTRARKRLCVTAVSNEDSIPSRFLDDVDPPQRGEGERGGGRTLSLPARPLSLPSVVAGLRHVVCDPSQPDMRRHAAAYQLARLADAGVASADPNQWYGMVDISVGDPMIRSQQVRVSPSKVEEFNRCELRWALKACGATDADMSRVGVGAFVHALAEQAAHHDWSPEQLMNGLEAAWPPADVGEGWVARREYQRVRDMVERLGRWLRDNTRTLVASEASFDVKVGNARVVGRVDRLERDEHGRLVVIDYKTGTSAPTAAELGTHPQLGTYQVAVTGGAFDQYDGGQRHSGGAQLVHLGVPSRDKPREQQQPPLDESDNPGWAEDLLKHTADGMAQRTFHAHRGRWCGFCPARPSCPIFSDQVTS